MAENEVKLVITADSSGTDAALSRVGAGMQKLESGTASLVSNIKSHWLGFTAAIAGAAIVLNKAWSLAEMAAKYEEQMNMLNQFAATYNTTATSIVADIKEITNGQIAMADIAKISTKALALDLPLDKYKELAKYADAVGDTLRMSTTQALETLAEAAEKGTEKTMKQIVGVVDLDSKYGKLTESMTEHEKIGARVNIMLDTLKEKYGETGVSIDSTADKMERMTASIKDLQLTIGQLVIRGGTALMGVFQGAASAALYLSSGVFGLVSALGKLTDLLHITKGLSAEYKTAKEAALGASKELWGKAGTNLETAFASSADLAKAMEPPGGREDNNQKIIDRQKAATKEWQSTLDSLNPTLDETARKVTRLWEAFGKAKDAGVKDAGKQMFEMLQKITDQAKLDTVVKAFELAAEAEKKTITERIDGMKTWRDTAMQSYNDAIAKAKEYQNLQASLNATIEDLANRRARLFGPQLTPQQQMEQEASKLQDMYSKASSPQDYQSLGLKAMDYLEKFKDMENIFGGFTAFEKVKTLQDDVITKMKDMSSEAGLSANAWNNFANTAAQAIDIVDKWVVYLQSRITELDGQITAVKVLQVDTSKTMTDLDAVIAKVLYLKSLLATGGGKSEVPNPPPGQNADAFPNFFGKERPEG